MRHLRSLIPIILFIGFIAGLTAYGGGSSAPPTTPVTPTTITGKAEAPGGVIAQFESSKPILLATLDFIFPVAGAAITGLLPVGGATVELIRIDDNGVQVGAVLASTVSSSTGNYSLSLPTGVGLAGDLIVRISGFTESMSAMVVDQTVNINPVSQFVLDKFVDDPNLVLVGLSPTACPCWTFEDLSNEFLNDPHDIYCINTQFETEIISKRLTGATHISSASVISQLFNDPNTGRCNASFENVRIFNSSFIADPKVIEVCLNDLDQLLQSRQCR